MIKILKVVFFVFLISFMVWASLHYKAQNRTSAIREVPFFRDHFEIIAYRGGGLEAPENTLSAFEKAVNVNPDVILHLNTQISVDKKVVVFFDENLARTTDGSGLVWKKTGSELKQLNAAAKFKDDTGKNPYHDSKVEIPFLEEVIKRFPKQRFIIELGQRYKELAILVYNIVNDNNAFPRTIITAENNQPLKYLRQLDPRVFLGASQDEVLRLTILISLGWIGLDPMRADAYFVPKKYDSVPVLSAELINEIHKREKKIYVRIVNEKSDLDNLRLDHIDGIATDKPRAIFEQIKN